MRLCERVLFAWVVIYAMDNLGMSAKELGILTTVEVVALHRTRFAFRR